MLKFFNRGGKNRPITPKTNREISDDEIESSVSIANEDELEAFANEKKDDGQQAVLIGKNKNGDDVIEVPDSESENFYITYEDGKFYFRQNQFKNELLNGYDNPQDRLGGYDSLESIEKYQRNRNFL